MITLNFFANINTPLAHRLNNLDTQMDLEALADQTEILVYGFDTHNQENAQGWVLKGDYNELSDWLQTASERLHFSPSKLEQALLRAKKRVVTIDTLSDDPEQFDTQYHR